MPEHTDNVLAPPPSPASCFEASHDRRFADLKPALTARGIDYHLNGVQP